MIILSALGSGLDHPEGVAFSDRHGLFAGGEAGQIYRIDLDTHQADLVANTGGYILGLAFGPDGRLYCCDMARRSVLAVEIASGEIEDVSTGRGVEFAVPNHLVFARDGSLYVSDSGGWPGPLGSIARFAPDGSGRVVDRTAGMFPNGLAIDPSGQWLFVVETSASAVSRLRIAGEALEPAERVVELPRSVPDGLAFAADGSLLISCYRPDAVYRWTPESGVALVADDWTGLTMSAPTNLVFAGEARDRLITANLANSHLCEIHGSELRGAEVEFTRA